MIKRLYQKYNDIIPYGVFGILTTVINWVVYKLTYGILNIPNVPATCIAWLLAVVFAFITNKLWVFHSKSLEKDVVLKEAVPFFTARIATGILDVIIMWATVDILRMNADFWKIISNVLVIIINYIASKFIIFKDKSYK